MSVQLKMQTWKLTLRHQEKPAYNPKNVWNFFYILIWISPHTPICRAPFVWLFAWSGNDQLLSSFCSQSLLGIALESTTSCQRVLSGRKNLVKLTKGFWLEILPASSRGLIDFPQLHGSQYGLVDHICPTKRGDHAHHRPCGHLHGRRRHRPGGLHHGRLKKDKNEIFVGILQ